MSLIKFQHNLILTWSTNSVFLVQQVHQAGAITDTKCYVQVVTLSFQDNLKLLLQLKS